jgi:hypothetical protein
MKILVNCNWCGHIMLDPAEVTVLMASLTAVFVHCGTDQALRLTPHHTLMLSVAGCPMFDAREADTELSEIIRQGRHDPRKNHP